MAESLTVEAPDFDLLRKETGRATEDAIRTLWYVVNNEMRQRRQLQKRSDDRLQGKILTSTVTTNQNNFDTENALIVLFTGASALNLTGLRNGEEGRTVVLLNIGAGTITVKHASASSDALNRFNTAAAADVSLVTGKTVIVSYANSLWREVKPV